MSLRRYSEEAQHELGSHYNNKVLFNLHTTASDRARDAIYADPHTGGTTLYSQFKAGAVQARPWLESIQFSKFDNLKKE